MDHRIKIKLGALELEYEGTEDYLKNELPKLIDKLIAIKIPISEESDIPNGKPPIPDTIPELHSTFQMSTNTIASKLGMNSGPDLIMAACANLALVKNKETFHRKDILAEMQSASNYYKISHSKNLSASLKSLVGGDKLIERAKDVFALTAEQKKSIKLKLGVN